MTERAIQLKLFYSCISCYYPLQMSSIYLTESGRYSYFGFLPLTVKAKSPNQHMCPSWESMAVKAIIPTWGLLFTLLNYNYLRNMNIMSRNTESYLECKVIHLTFSVENLPQIFKINFSKTNFFESKSFVKSK